jgi:cell volume regulation protein A
MFVVDQLILYGGILVLVAIVSRKFSARFGVPVLVLFLLVGMLAGSEGIGGIAFEDYGMAHAIGTVALVIILFDGGLRTRREQLRIGWKPAATLATLGVLVTAVITGVVAALIIDISPLQGLLLGSIVASTDAAAVFSILRSQGVHLGERLKATLEVESGSNDPMAVFLTVGIIEVLLAERDLGFGLLLLFVQQMGIGFIVGYAGGRGAVYVINRIRLDAAGLYPVLVVALGFLIFGIAALGQGSGFLAVYVAGIVIGNSPIVFQRGTYLFHDGLAWVSQIAMFVVLGLLSFPSQLIDIAWQGLGVAAGLMFVARPLAVFLLLAPFRFSLRELTFISWVGLKGAVPIILSIYPFLFGIDGSSVAFNITFFVVLVSAVTQGWTLPVAARLLDLEEAPPSEPPATLEITSIHQVNADIVEYEITDRSRAAHLRISELTRPDDVVIAMVTHGNEIIPARGPTVLLPGDHLFIILRPGVRAAVDEVFAPGPEHAAPLRAGILVPSTLSIEQLDELYGIELEGHANETIGDVIRRLLKQPMREGAYVEAGDVLLYVHSVGESGDIIIGVEAPA